MNFSTVTDGVLKSTGKGMFLLLLAWFGYLAFIPASAEIKITLPHTGSDSSAITMPTSDAITRLFMDINAKWGVNSNEVVQQG
jgi:hypothetical protein